MLPMLAHDYNKRGKSIVWPAYVQPKLDGIRVIAMKTQAGMKYYSRNGKEFKTLNHWSDYLLPCLNVGEAFDGEAFRLGTTFEDICSAVKRDQANADSRRMQYWVYDHISERNIPYQERLRKISLIFDEDDINMIVRIPTVLVNEHELDIAHKAFTKAGFEGTIIRNATAPYEHKRSVHLQKYKDFQDEEFQIVGGKEGIGKDKGAVIFTCVTKDGKNFDVRPSATDDTRREMWKDLDDYVGQWLTVRFQNYSDGGTPRFPIGKTIRNYE